MRRLLAIALPCLLFAACASPRGLPSLAKRPAEALDPRVPIPSAITVRPASASFSDRVAALISQAEAGDRGFAPVMANAERLAAGVGPVGSESWIAAQQALTAAQSARLPVANALGDIDKLAGDALQSSGTIAPGDLAAVQRGEAAIQHIDDRQAQRFEALRRRLGS